MVSLLSSVLIVVAFRHLVSHHSILLAFIFILLFSRAMAIAISPLLFSLLELPCHSLLLSAIFKSSRHFNCHAIFIASVYFIAVQPVILLLFIQGWTFVLLSCRFCSGPVVAIFILMLETFLL